MLKNSSQRNIYPCQKLTSKFIEDIDNTVTPPETDDEYTTIHHVQIISLRNEQTIYIKKSLFTLMRL